MAAEVMESRERNHRSCFISGSVTYDSVDSMHMAASKCNTGIPVCETFTDRNAWCSNTRYNLDVDSLAAVEFKNRFIKKFILKDRFDRGSKNRNGRVEKPLTEVYPVGLYIKRVPKFVFSDADYWVPVFARVEGLPSDKAVEIQDLKVPVFRKKKKVDGYSAGNVEWGIGDGTTSDKKERKVKFKNQKNAPADIKQRENGKLYFTAFVNNKEALGKTVIAKTDKGKKIHAFNRSEIFSFRISKLKKSGFQ